MSITIYGIKQCDTCCKALKWLDEEGLEYRWVDVRADGVEADRLSRWISALGAEKLVNRRSTTWRQLPSDQRPALDSDDWLGLLQDQPTLIKRPIVEHAAEITVGFTEAVRDRLSRA
ncbi:MAG: arsenate reductase [Pseudomonadota bacterium]